MKVAFFCDFLHLSVERCELVVDVRPGQVHGESVPPLLPLLDDCRPVLHAHFLGVHEPHPLGLVFLCVQHVHQVELCVQTNR